MSKKTTEELEHILSSASGLEAGRYLQEQSEELLTQPRAFREYMHQMLRKYGKSQQEVFLQADLPERFGYKLLSEEKHTKQRDYILRICYAAGMDLPETQRALTLYGMAPLYARIPRDAVLMIAFNRRVGSVLDVNALLSAHKMPTLKTSGSLE